MKRLSLLALAYGLQAVFWSANAQEKATDRWGANFKDRCFCPALDADISYSVRMPPKVAGLEKYPLVVVIKNGLKVAPSAEHPFIEVKPPSGGIWGYRAMSGVFVRTVIAHIKNHYPIDEDRVYLVGFSAGASGAMQVASMHGDQFAAVLPLVAVGTDYPIVNFRNLPVAQHHGTVDWTSAICNARGQHQRMLAMGCPAELTEYEGVGHSVPRPHGPIVEWMLKQKRERSPNMVMHDCETTSLGKAYWISIDSFLNQHERASVRASLEGTTLRVEAENVAIFQVDFDAIETEGLDEMVIDGLSVSLEKFSGSQRFLRYVRGNRWDPLPTPPKVISDDKSIVRQYEVGAAANLYQGEPLLVVYGTAGEHASKLQNAAKRLAACGGPHPGAMGQHFPVVADSDLTPEQQANFNLILVGAPGENLITDRLLPTLPLKIDGEILQVGGRSDLSLKNRVLSLLHPHPEHPWRLIYLVAPVIEADADWKRFVENPQRFLIGSDGFDRISQADLAVTNLDQKFCRQMRFVQGWKWGFADGADINLPDRFGERSELAREFMKSMLQASSADFALWWGPADQGMWGADFNFLPRFNPECYTLADFRTQRRQTQTLTGSVTGTELRAIWKRWGDNDEMIFEPTINLLKIDDEKSYRLHVPMDFYIKLGQRKKALLDPKPGPRMSIADLESAIFGE